MTGRLALLGSIGRRLWLAAVFCLLWLAPSFAAEIRSIGIASLSDGAVAVVLDATGPAAISATALRNPDRLVLDLPGAPYRGAAGDGAGRGFVDRFRVGDAGGEAGSSTRIILDIGSPALAESVEMVPGAIGVRMIIRLSPVEVEEFALAAKDIVAEDVVTTGSTGAGADESAVAVNAAPADRMTIVIDPGHGGVDPGASSPDGLSEKEITLAFAEALKAELERRGGFAVSLTRTSDVFVSLDDRVRIAREQQAGLMISVHADNLADEPGVRGSTVYTLADKASDARSARLAEKENAVDTLGGVAAGVEDSKVSDILFDLARRETRIFSNRFAQTLVSELGQSVKINKNPHRFARFRVLTAPDVPSVLLELGYLSSEEDAKLVADPEWRANAAAETADAIVAFAGARSAMLR